MIALLLAEQADAVVYVTPRKPYFMEITPEAIFTILFGIKNGLNRGVLSPSLNSANYSSKVVSPMKITLLILSILKCLTVRYSKS